MCSFIHVMAWRKSMDNLLYDPIFRIETAQGLEQSSLPALFVALSKDRVESFLGLQRHQDDAFHVFLCYLAGAALVRLGQTEPEQPEGFWRDGLLNLSEGQENAWKLLVENPLEPAFMQPPVTDLSLSKKYEFTPKEGPKAETPDQLDLLAVSKNHDIKYKRSKFPEIEQWVYSLISLQTCTCYCGRHYGTARINGTSARPVVEFMDSTRWGKRWKTNTARLLQYRPRLLDKKPYKKNSGLVLSWLAPWNLEASLSLQQMDAFFVEISRAIRLVMSGGKIIALGATSKPRVIAKAARDEIKGNLGDPWTPISLKSGGAAVFGEEGFSSSRLHNLIFADVDENSIYSSCEFMKATSAADGVFHATALARRGGTDSTTEGLHCVDIPIPGRIAFGFAQRNAAAATLGKISRSRIKDAETMWRQVLKPALYKFLDGGTKQKPEEIGAWQTRMEKRLKAWLEETEKSFNAAWSRDFFPLLWDVDLEDEKASRQEWITALKIQAESILKEAAQRFPKHSSRNYRSQVYAEEIFKLLYRLRFEFDAPPAK
jgi:CRISPR system Cascade subunit CasA